ncbi:MAG: GNAT family N-acetyltransferase [Sphingobium sp.]|nr:GNAT family N-acetyltransferase [Sphingobium sp.]
MPAYPPLATERLLLRPVTIADAPAMQAVFPQWEIVRFLDSRIPWPYPPDGARNYLRHVVLPFVEKGMWWSWSIRTRAEPNRLVGMIDLFDWTDDNRGFWIDPAAQGHGYASEASEAVTDYWFDVLKRPVMRIPKAIENEASQRISEKQGMRRIDRQEKDYVGGRMMSDVWEITAQEWRARRR